jgi:hypothetical protein
VTQAEQRNTKIQLEIGEKATRTRKKNLNSREKTSNWNWREKNTNSRTKTTNYSYKNSNSNIRLRCYQKIT